MSQPPCNGVTCLQRSWDGNIGMAQTLNGSFGGSYGAPKCLSQSTQWPSVGSPDSTYTQGSMDQLSFDNIPLVTQRQKGKNEHIMFDNQAKSTDSVYI